MRKIIDINEIFKILDGCCAVPVYKTIGVDEEGNQIAVPVYTVGENKPKHGGIVNG